MKNSSKPTIRSVLELVVEEILDGKIFFHEAVNEFEKIFIQKALERSRGNLSAASGRMGIHRNTLSKKIRLHGIDPQTLKLGRN